MKLNFRKYKKLKRKNDFLEPEEILFNKESLSHLEAEDDLQRLEIEVGRWGIKSLAYFFIVFLVGILGLVFYLGIIRGEYFKASAEKNSLKSIAIPAERGLFYDRYQKPLVSNKPVFDLVFFPNYLPTDKNGREELFQKIENALNISPQFLEEAVKEPEAFLHSVVLKPNLTSQEAIVQESYFAGFLAVQVIRQNAREYKSPFVFSHLIGYLGRVSKEDLKIEPSLLDFERIGKVGLEAFYEKELRGEPGEVNILRNAAMEIVGQSYGKKPKSGQNLHLTVDKEFQEYLYWRLQSQINSLGGERGGVALAIDSQTGEVLALVSYPGFNSNAFSLGISEEELAALLNSKTKTLFNRVIAGLYNPGSAIKPIMAVAGLEEKLIDPAKKIETHGFLSIPNPYDPEHPSIFLDWKDHGTIDLKAAISRSSNVYFYILGGGYNNIEGLGINRIGQYLEKFGFDKTAGIDLFSEGIGFVPHPEEKKNDIWRLGDTYNVSIGQGDLVVTPLRLLVNLNSLVNGGRILKPFLVKKVTDAEGKTLKENQSTSLLENFLKPDNLKVVKEAMIETVKSSLGTGHVLSDLPFSVGGKSGTAQVAMNTKVNAIFFAFAPTDNPKISILVLIENAREGSLNAIPVAKDALLWYYQKRGL